MRVFASWPSSAGSWLIGLGVSLPVFVFVAMLGVRWLANAIVPPPSHDLLFTLTFWQKPVPVDFYIQGGRTMVRNRGNELKGAYRPEEKLYLFEHRTQSIRRIPIDPPVPGAEPIAVRPDLRVLPKRQAPDGWRVLFRDGPWPFLLVVKSTRPVRSHLVMDNLGARVRIPLPPEAQRAQRKGMEVLGWIINYPD